MFCLALCLAFLLLKFSCLHLFCFDYFVLAVAEEETAPSRSRRNRIELFDHACGCWESTEADCMYHLSAVAKGKSVEINGFEHFLRFLCEKVDGVMGKNFVKD